ncbi:MAG: type II toxin-antitoxin system VapC family toxin [Lachnospiraceae bacterium]|jgi:Predicted nucleic acid-binding protein, contains PIN domain
MKYMLDTNTCIFAMKQKGNVIANLMKYKPEDICISSITYAELVYGVEKSQAKDKNRLALALFLSDIQVIPYDDNAAQEYGYIRADLQQKGIPIGPMDMLIASHAKALGMTIVTNNTNEFKRVSGLKLEDWL